MNAKGKFFSQKDAKDLAKTAIAAKLAPWTLVPNPAEKYFDPDAGWSVRYGDGKVKSFGFGHAGAHAAAKFAAAERKKEGKKNPQGAAAERFQDFHGEPAKEVLEWEERIHYHGVTSGIGELVSLVIRVPKIRGGGEVTVKGFKGAHLTMNEAGTQLYVEGGDQSLDLASFGIKTEHDKEHLGELIEVTYHTTKTHLGRDGGTANYVHRFGKMESSGRKTERPQMFYDVLNEEILFAGGGYEIPSEGIDG